ncbi:MAG: hypothetical protein WCT77_05355 [Bacteroidota bacterium]
MKKFTFILTLVLILNISHVFSSDNFPMGVGPFISLKGGVNAASVPNGVKNDFAFNPLPDFGVTGYFPLTDKSQFGIAADLAYSTYAFGTKLTNDVTNKTAYRVSYLSLAPNLYVSGFIIGFNFGLPLNGKAKNTNYISETDIKTDDLAFLVEIHIGGMIPLFYNETGRLNLILQGGYALTGLYNDNRDFNPHPASASVGIGYIFNIMDYFDY